jgi:hypothetical protein
MTDQQGILSNLRVIDCGTYIAAPAAATIMADFGAEVSKIERPPHGDPYRQLSFLKGMPVSEHNYCWLLDARNKKSLALDLQDEAGREALRRLVMTADVFITNYPPEIARRFAVRYEDLSAINARLIHAQVTGYGEEGEDTNKPGYDTTAYWARSGLTGILFDLAVQTGATPFYTANRVLTPKELSGDLSESLELINQCCAATLQAQGPEAALAQLRGLYAQNRGPQLYYQFPTNANGFPLGNQYANNTLYQPIPGNNLARQLAQNRLAQEIFKLYPTPQNPGPFTVFIRPDGLWDRTGANAFTARGVKSVDDRYSFRMDHQVSDRDRANFRYTFVPVRGTRFNFLGFNSPANPIAQDDNKSRNFVFSETHTFGGTKVNEFRASYTRGTQFRGPNELALSKDWGAELGLVPATKGAGYPAIGGLPAPNGIGSGGGTGLVLDTNLGFADDFSWLRGRHSFKLGTDIRFFQANRLDATGVFGGSYTFSGFTNGPATPGVAGPSVGGSNVASFIRGIMNSVSIRRVQIPFYYRWKYYARRRHDAASERRRGRAADQQRLAQRSIRQ